MSANFSTTVTPPSATTISSKPPTFYEAFHGQGILYDTLPCTAVHLILELIGVFGNGSIIFVTLKNQGLRGTCGTLLCIGAVGDILHQLSHYFLTYLMFSGTIFTTLETCVHVNIVPVIGLCVGVLMILFIAIDRLVCIMMPTRHRTINKTLYIGVYLLATALYCAYVIFSMFQGLKADPTFLTTCLITDAMPGGIGQTWFMVCLIINGSTVACYFVLWITLKYKTSSSESTKKMFKSLAAITLMVVLGWAINAIIQVLLRALEATPVTYWYTGFYAGVPVNIACSCNYFVLYAFSKDYRRAFQDQLNGLSRVLCQKDVFKNSSDVAPRTVTLSTRSSIAVPNKK